MTTCADLITDTERLMLSGDRDVINRLTTAVDASETALVLEFATLEEGAYLNIDLETMYVFSIDESSSTATVQRGMLGSTAAAHAVDSLVYQNPISSKWDIFDALNGEIRSLSPILFQAKTFDLTSEAVRITYAIPTINTDILDVLEVRFHETGAENAWPSLPLRNVQILREMATSDFASGMALRIETGLTPGRPLRVRYAAPFTDLAALDDDVVTDCGLAASMVDIPSLGAAAQLVASREVKRSLTERSVDSRRAGEVGSGAAARAAAVLMQMRDSRVRDEASKLSQQWPRHQ